MVARGGPQARQIVPTIRQPVEKDVQPDEVVTKLLGKVSPSPAERLDAESVDKEKIAAANMTDKVSASYGLIDTLCCSQGQNACGS